ncbi:hypothetical protein MKR81_26795 (plasmid) [Vibrio campbellii]|uniref:hypothetical protein n=1 Tax=Vibrio campbellii TaxID=680 RepID=UPI001F0732F8|nr:hypothetical protein [Vibrio campbellii]UMM06872.1 hypothetical protein MKR81_26795 [Vibrio campbellii]
MNKKLREFVTGKLYAKLNLFDCKLLQELRPVLRKDNISCELICPACWNHSAYHYFGTAIVTCTNCNEQTDLIAAMVATGEHTEETAVEEIAKKLSIVIPSYVNPRKNPPEKKPIAQNIQKEQISKIDAGWLVSQLRLWLTNDRDTVGVLEKCGWTKELLAKAPIGKLPSPDALIEAWDGRLPEGLFRSIKDTKGGIVVPWFNGRNEVLLWGYEGSMLENEPKKFVFGESLLPCHIHHPVNRRNRWLVVVADPVLASLLIARGIPACAVGGNETVALCAKWFETSDKDVFVMSESSSPLFSEIVKHAKNAKPLKKVEPLAFGPYHGAYYKRFTKWPISRFQTPEVQLFNVKQVIGLLSTLLDAEMPLDEAIDVIKQKTGHEVTVKPIAGFGK